MNTTNNGWMDIETAPKDGTVINLVARYPDAISGFPQYGYFNKSCGRWYANSRAPLHEIIPWAWRERDYWPEEPHTPRNAQKSEAVIAKALGNHLAVVKERD